MEKQKDMIHNEEEKLLKTDTDMTQMTDLVEKDIKAFNLTVPYVQEGRGKHSHVKKHGNYFF